MLDDFRSGIPKRPRLSRHDANRSDGVPTLYFLFDRNSRESIIKTSKRSSDDSESGQDETDSYLNDDGDDESPNYDGTAVEPSIVPPASSEESSIIPYQQYPPMRGVNRDSKSSTEDSDNSDTDPKLERRWQTFFKQDIKQNSRRKKGTQPMTITDLTKGNENMILSRSLSPCMSMSFYPFLSLSDYVCLSMSVSVLLTVCLSLSGFVGLPLSICLCPSMSMSMSVYAVCLSMSVCLPACVRFLCSPKQERTGGT